MSSVPTGHRSPTEPAKGETDGLEHPWPGTRTGPDREVELPAELRTGAGPPRIQAPDGRRGRPDRLGGDRPGRRQMAPLFEADQPDPAPATSSAEAAGAPRLVSSFEVRRRTPRTWLLIALALTLAVGLAAGFAVGLTRVDGKPTSARATRSHATQPAPTPPTSVAVQLTATSACLETARRADEIIHLFIANKRQRASDLLVAYSVASRQCRRDASP